MLIIGSKFPFRFPFPGVIFALDRLEKEAVHHAIENGGDAPSWLGALAKAKKVVTPDSLRLDHESGMTLIGRPDDVFEMPNGSLGLVDYKTAAFKGEEDPLFHKYAVQLGAYRLLLEEEFEKDVSNSGLVYFEADAGKETDSGLQVDFSAHWLSVRTDLDQVNALLEEAYSIAMMEGPPEAGEKCVDCQRNTRVYELLQEVAQPVADSATLRFFSLKDRTRIEATVRHRKSRLDSVLAELSVALAGIRSERDLLSVITLWDFADEDDL